LHEKGGEVALQDISRKKPCPKNRLDEPIEKAVVAFTIEKPPFEQLRVSNELRKQGLFISLSGLRSLWVCHDLGTFKKRLKTVEATGTQERLILTEDL
jgi:hypothetical protein